MNTREKEKKNDDFRKMNGRKKEKSFSDAASFYHALKKYAKIAHKLYMMRFCEKAKRKVKKRNRIC